VDARKGHVITDAAFFQDVIAVGGIRVILNHFPVEDELRRVELDQAESASGFEDAVDACRVFLKKKKD